MPGKTDQKLQEPSIGSGASHDSISKNQELVSSINKYAAGSSLLFLYVTIFCDFYDKIK